MTNEYSAGKLSILKCDQCRDGYLIVKPGKGSGFFLGCTNYKKDGTGCGKIIWKQQYYDIMHLSPDPVPAKVFPSGFKNSVKSERETKKDIQKEDIPDIKKANVTAVEYEEKDLNEVIHTILQGLLHISEMRYYGITVLIDVLRGANSKRIIDAKLNTLPEYGKLVQLRRDDLHAIIEWMLENHFMLKTKGQYPVLHPTYEGMHYDEIVTSNKLKKLQERLLS